MVWELGGSLLSLFRLVYDGGGPYESYLPARHGELFDPDAFPFLEGRLQIVLHRWKIRFTTFNK